MADDDRTEELREAFDAFDIDGNGIIDAEEFGRLLDALDAGMSDEEKAIGFAEIDDNGNGQIEFSEFYRWWTDR
jgi:calmodulin